MSAVFDAGESGQTRPPAVGVGSNKIRNQDAKLVRRPGTGSLAAFVWRRRLSPMQSSAPVDCLMWFGVATGLVKIIICGSLDLIAEGILRNSKDLAAAYLYLIFPVTVAGRGCTMYQDKARWIALTPCQCQTRELPRWLLGYISPAPMCCHIHQTHG
ncbi:hypothetical protein BO94DRAFT_200857 [Aspergillus sclerotioniger CBS 115572]|uniref:Uncharacterized protein n=1 Tax=Aspergillus sclerotioniger CBS 115572 TaxID=1450535 RepID=A0A317VU63_9EURO|nr:hypothetical protein BO94DRAFT_200857 [Aspergillus sclerotioniger CBS 115572]PWY76398.1 hypothetical protein BO94DRAFT_200857 [Aspergillus sclerotioniger CBS 115572]